MLLIVLLVAAAPKLCVTPTLGVSEDVAGELAEQERAAALAAKVEGGLLVMSKKTFEAKRKEKNLAAPCTDSDCDFALAKALEADLVLSSKALKDDHGYVLVEKLLSTTDGKMLSQRTVSVANVAGLVTKAGPLVGEVLSDAFRATPPSMGSAASAGSAPTVRAKAALDTTKVIRESQVAMGENNDLFGRNGDLALYGDRLVFQMTGLNINNVRIVIDLSDVESVYQKGDEVVVETSGKKYRFTAPDNAGWREDLERVLAAAK